MARRKKSQLPWPSSPVPPPATSPNHAHGGWRLQRLTVAAVDEVEASPIGSASTSLLIGDFDVHAVESVARHLCPNAIFLHRHLVHLDVVDFELAGLLVHPEIDVIVLVLAAGLAEVGAGEILAFLLTAIAVPLFRHHMHRRRTGHRAWDWNRGGCR